MHTNRTVHALDCNIVYRYIYIVAGNLVSALFSIVCLFCRLSEFLHGHERAGSEAPTQKQQVAINLVAALLLWPRALLRAMMLQRTYMYTGRDSR